MTDALEPIDKTLAWIVRYPTCIELQDCLNLFEDARYVIDKYEFMGEHNVWVVVTHIENGSEE